MDSQSYKRRIVLQIINQLLMSLMTDIVHLLMEKKVASERWSTLENNWTIQLNQSSRAKMIDSVSKPTEMEKIVICCGSKMSRTPRDAHITG